MTTTEAGPAFTTVTVLHGHTSPETAYVIEDYPYGARLRCKKRMWVETAAKGAKKGQQRVVSQTTNPRRAEFGEVWNKPHPGQYSRMVWMYLDEIGHVQTTGVSEYGLTPETHARLQLLGIVDQMTADDARLYELLLKVSKRYTAPWDRWSKLLRLIVDQYTATGQIPERDDRGLVDGAGYVNEFDFAVAAEWVRRGM